MAARPRGGALAAFTGARRGELLALKWDEVNLDAGVIVIRRSTVRVAGGPVTGTTQSGRTRSTAMDPAPSRHYGPIASGSPWTNAVPRPLGRSRPGLRQTTGEALYPDSPSAELTKIVTAEGRPRLRLHDLRHLHATLLLQAGEPLHVVAERLGHRDAMVTATIYSHVMEGQAAAAADTFAAIIENGH